MTIGDAMATFDGFTREAIDFLTDLRANNDRGWFQPRKADYERLLKRPMEDLCRALADEFAARGLPMVADPAKSPFRIYRDVRFSRDKTPYTTHASASFPWREGGAEARIGAYFHFEPGRMSAGGGMWHPETPRIAAWRALVASDAARVHAATEDPGFVAEFGEIGGDRLTRVPAGYPKDHPDADLLRLKDVVFGRPMSDAEALSPHLPLILADAFGKAIPVFRLLASVEPVG
jgi:uncharacterized protein (TIGR02453 family)